MLPGAGTFRDLAPRGAGRADRSALGQELAAALGSRAGTRTTADTTQAACGWDIDIAARRRR